MKVFTCSHCRGFVFFDNVRCLACGHRLAYLPDRGVLSALQPVDAAPEGDPESCSRDFVALASGAAERRYRLCGNGADHQVCNWAVPVEDPERLCRACRLNEVIPNLDEAQAREAWRRVEAAKRRLFSTLFDLGLPVVSRRDDPEGGLAFRFKKDQPGGGEKVMTGHDRGTITLNVAEADAPFRETMRESMGETYRTLLGHFRHEIGHYYWERFFPGEAERAAFRPLFGDERADYAQAVERHYREGAPADWPAAFVSAYATTHPWEDWAETFAHYLHMVETLDTARSYGLAVRAEPPADGPAARPLVVTARRLDFDDFDDLARAWVPLTIALNSLNRAMGLADLYPFAVSNKALEKLRFVHDGVERVSGRSSVPK